MNDKPAIKAATAKYTHIGNIPLYLCDSPRESRTYSQWFEPIDIWEVSSYGARKAAWQESSTFAFLAPATADMVGKYGGS